MRTPFAFGIAAFVAVSALAAVARSEIVVVNVLGHDFSINPPLDPNIQDAVVQVGDTVRWNFTSALHSTTSVVGSAETWDSGIIFSLPFTFDHTFQRTGVFHYYCGIHGFDNLDGTAGGMAGTITVLAAGPTCDLIDFNGDGLFPDTQDISDFLAVFAGGVCDGQAPTDPPCNTDIDFNNDTLFPDTADIETFLRVFGGGGC